MICPYIVNQHIYETVSENDELGRETTKIKEQWGYAECPKEECGAWQEGKCKYHENND